MLQLIWHSNRHPLNNPLTTIQIQSAGFEMTVRYCDKTQSLELCRKVFLLFLAIGISFHIYWPCQNVYCNSDFITVFSAKLHFLIRLDIKELKITTTLLVQKNAYPCREITGRGGRGGFKGLSCKVLLEKGTCFNPSLK